MGDLLICLVAHLGLAYASLRHKLFHKVFDMDFALNRLLVFGCVAVEHAILRRF